MSSTDPLFASLGIFIIDEIHFADGTSIYEIMGGGGMFGAVGSRMVLGEHRSKRCGWVVDTGNDCPKQILDQLYKWNTGAIYREHPERQCNRGWNKYGENDLRLFDYTTPKMEVTVDDLERYGLIRSKSFHFLLSPHECLPILDKLDELGRHPIIVWEPEPNDSKKYNWEKYLPVLSRIDVLSPNAAECAELIGMSEPHTKKECESLAEALVPYMKKPGASVVMRCGALGCLLMTTETSRWFPPYHTGSSVVDPTGCGNTFVGAMATALAIKEKDLVWACQCGTVAAGASIEQHGPPTLTDGDKWNGLTFDERLEIYRTAQKT